MVLSHLLLVAAAFQSNLLTNPDFNSNTNGWSTAAAGASGHTFDHVASYSGHGGLAHILVPSNTTNVFNLHDPNGTGLFPQYGQNVTISGLSLVPGAVVELSCSVNQEVSDGGVGLMAGLKFYDAANNELASNEARCHIDSMWTSVRTWCEIPTGATRVYSFFAFNAIGDVWLDGAQLSVVAPPPAAAPTSATLTVTSQVVNSSLIGFGAEDDGYFYNSVNVGQCNPGQTTHTTTDIDIRAQRVQRMNLDFVRMFFNHLDWAARSDQVFEFEFPGALEGWQIAGQGLQQLRVAAGALTANYVAVTPQSSFDPYLVSPSGMEIDAATDKYLLLDVAVQSTSTSVNFQFYFETATGWHSVTFPVTANQPMQRQPVLDLSTASSHWTGTVTRFRLDTGNASDMNALVGGSVSVGLIAVSANSSTPTHTPYHFTSDNMESHYRSLEDWQRSGTPVDIVHVGWGTNEAILYDSPLRVQKLAVDLLHHLIVTKGFTCVRYWTLANEPNHHLTQGVVQDFGRWTDLHTLVRSGITADGLDVRIMGSDDAGGLQWFRECATQSSHAANLGALSSHLYVDKRRRAIEPFVLDAYMDVVESVNSPLPLVIGEFAILDDRTSPSAPTTTPNNPLMTEYEHALWTTEYIVRALDRGLSGGSIWTLQDSYYLSTATVNGPYKAWWGTWGYKNLGPAPGWPIYPTYHALANVTRYTNEGDRVWRVTSTAPEHLPAVVVGNAATGRTLFWSNTSTQSMSVAVAGDTIDQLCIVDAATVGSAYDKTGTRIDRPAGNVFTAPAQSFGWCRFVVRPDFSAAMSALGFTAFTDQNGGFGLTPNGVPDSVELALLADVLADARWYPHDPVDEAWRANYDRLGFDAGGVTLSPNLRLYAAGLLTLGDTQSVDAARRLCSNAGIAIVASNYDASAAWAVSIHGDADADLTTNANEFVAAGGDRVLYVRKCMAPELGSLPPTFDINGPGLTPNGIPEVAEFALVAALLEDRDLYGSEAITAAYHLNRKLVRERLNQAWWDSLGTVLALYLTLGDTDSANVPVTVGLNTTGADLSQSWALAKNGDADADSLSNATEHSSAASVKDYVVAALVPDWTAACAAIGLSGTFDINGGNWGPNGLPDLHELALLAEILTDPNVPVHGKCHLAYHVNRRRMRVDANQPLQDPLSTILAALMTIGDAGSVFIPAAIFGIGTANYDTSRIGELALLGDADGDGRTNQQEHANAGGVLSTYLKFALDRGQ